MAFTKFTKILNTITSLTDRPNKQSGVSPDQMKQLFEDDPQAIQAFINSHIEELESTGTAEQNAGAKNIGVSQDADFHSPDSSSDFFVTTNIEDVLHYFRELIRSAVAGQIGDNDIKTNMLSHTLNSEAVDTGSIRKSAVTNEKLAGGITKDKIASVKAAVIDGVLALANLPTIPANKIGTGITANQLEGNIPSEKLTSVSTTKLSGQTALLNGGTGADNAPDARANLDTQQQHTEQTVTVAVEDWAAGTTCTIDVQGVTASNLVIMSADSDSAEEAGKRVVRMSAQAENSITLSAKATPTTALTFNFAIFS